MLKIISKNIILLNLLKESSFASSKCGKKCKNETVTLCDYHWSIFSQDLQFASSISHRCQTRMRMSKNNRPPFPARPIGSWRIQ
jgi:hypothetical protein